MVVIAIIGILAAIAIPQYSDYTSRARAAGTISELASVRHAVADCGLANLGVLTTCNTGVSEIPTIVTTRNITAGATTTAGVITGSSGATSGGAVPVNLTFQMQLTIAPGSNVVTWATTGTICDAIRPTFPSL